MKLQFSLATLLVCMTVLAVVIAIAVAMPVYQVESSYDASEMRGGTPVLVRRTIAYEVRKPTAEDIILRLMWAAPSSIAATLGVRWAIRRLKSRRHIEPPVR
jgi:hypothetical protein